MPPVKSRLIIIWRIKNPNASVAIAKKSLLNLRASPPLSHPKKAPTPAPVNKAIVISNLPMNNAVRYAEKPKLAAMPKSSKPAINVQSKNMISEASLGSEKM